MNIFDILILGFVLLGALQGYRKGLISGVLGLVGNILGLIIAAKEYLRVLTWLDQFTSLRDWLQSTIYKLLLPSVQSQAKLAEQQTIDRILSILPKELRDQIGSGAVPDVQSYTQNALQTITTNLSEGVTEALLKAIAFALTYFIFVLIIQILISLILGPLDLFSGSINRGGGFFVGAVGAFVGLAIFFGLLAPFIELAGTDTLWGLLQRSESYPYLVGTFTHLVDILRLNLEQGFALPFDFKSINLPEFQ